MSKQSFKDFKRFWLKNYQKQYKEGSRDERKQIRDNLYKIKNLTEDEKDKLFEEITMWGTNI